MKPFHFSGTGLRIRALGLGLVLVLFAGTPASARMGDMREMMQRMMGDVLPPGLDPKLLPEPESRGARLLDRYCTQCHRLPGPGRHTAADWPPVIERMGARIRMMQNMMGGMREVSVPDAAEWKALTEYLQRHAQRPIDPANYPDLNSPVGRAYSATCAQCHALPDPNQHTRAEWPEVVARMQKNMAVMNRPVPDPATTRAILGFLQKHARE